MKATGLLSLLFTCVVHLSAMADDRCSTLVSVPSPGDSPEAASVFFANADLAYRDCRSGNVPVETRAKAAINYGFANAIRNNPQTAIKAYNEALTLLANDRGDYTSTILDALDKAVQIEAAADMRTEAIAHSERALTMRRTAFGEDSEETLDSVVQLAMVLTQFKEYGRAEALLMSAVESARIKCKSAQCRSLANVFSGIAVFYAAQGDEDNERKYAELSSDATPGTHRKKERKD